MKKRKKLKQKVGILTYTRLPSYGAVLQSYALYKAIEKGGFKSYLIGYYRGRSLRQEISYWFERIRKRIFFTYERKERLPFDSFVSRHIKRKTFRFKSKLVLRLMNFKFDSFVVGSDQVWRYRYSKNNILHFMFDFVKEKRKKVAYAPSFGIEKWNEAPDQITKKAQDLLKKFDYLSVRESSGVEILREVFNLNAKHVLDPTLLLDEEDFSRLLLNKAQFSNKSYLATMNLDESGGINKLCERIGSSHGFEVFNLLQDKDQKNTKYVKYISVETWLSRIKYSDLIVTDSFHCVCFSIIFQKPFICIANPVRGYTRVHSLLNMLGLQSRLFKNVEEAEQSSVLDSDIDYEEIYAKLTVQKEISLNYLKNALS